MSAETNQRVIEALASYARVARSKDRDEEADAAFALVKLKRLDAEEIRSLASFCSIIATELVRKSREIGWNS